MGAFSSTTTIKVEDDGWDAGEYITIKGTVTAEDMERMTVSTTIMGEDGKPKQQSSVSMVASLQCMIEDWCLYGDNNQPVPLYESPRGGKRRKREEVIAKLPVSYMTPVMTAIGQVIQGAQLADPLASNPSANGPTAGH